MKTYSDYLNDIFPGTKVQKLSINAGFTCPNRDGSIATGGCIYCRNDSFTPGYCVPSDSISLQLEKGKKFFSRKYPEMKFLAYFQSYTNTYGQDAEKLRERYLEAIKDKDILGIVISTRPDTLSDETFKLLEAINLIKPVFLEIGAETADDATLQLINRNHTWKDVETASYKAKEAGLQIGLHLIAGLPGENRERILKNVEEACKLPINTLKIHQLQILEGTILYELWKNNQIPLTPFNLEDYLKLCVDIIKKVPSHIVIERFLSQSPPEMVIAPKWNMKNYEFMNRLRQLVAHIN